GSSCRNSFQEEIRLVCRFICYLVRTAAIFLLEAAETIQFCDMIFSSDPRVYLSNQSPVDLMARLEWHSVTMASSMLLAAIQRKFFVTVRSMVDHTESHSSRI